MKLKSFAAILFLMFLFPLAVLPQVATGGSFTLEKSLIAAGGERMTGGDFELVGNSGQANAGDLSHAMPLFVVRSGFYTPRQFAPTSASAVITGKTLLPSGRAIPNVRVTATSVDGTVIAAVTSSFGHYQLEGLDAGQAYVLMALHRGHLFSVRVVTPDSSITEVDFVAAPSENDQRNRSTDCSECQRP